MSRPRYSLTHYAGATGGLKFDRLERLAADPRWAFQSKSDGSYVELGTDRRGRISRLNFRTGTLLERDEHDGLLGLSIGIPDATLVGELEVYSEVAVRTVKTRGCRHIHVFDMIRHGSEYTARLPYRHRYERLVQWQSAIQAGETDGTYYETQRGAKDSVTHEYIKSTRKNLARLPLIPLATGKAGLEQLWHSYVEVGGGEGIVAVDLNAPVGARRAKLKCRRVETMDAVVVAVRERSVRCLWAGETFLVQAKRLVESGSVRVGDVVELKANGVHEFRSIPKHPRILRVRHDLRGTVTA